MQSTAELVAATPVMRRPALVAVDGVDASGKTTYADRLAAAYRENGRPAQVVHMDDFLNPRAVRYRLGRHSATGYFHDSYDLDSFQREVLMPLTVDGTREVRLQVFDYRSDQPVHEAPIRVPPEAVVIVEGMFLHRDELVAHWDISVFLDVPFSVSVGRMAERDGTHSDPTHPTIARYVEGQRIYLAQCQPMQRATFVVENF